MKRPAKNRAPELTECEARRALQPIASLISKSEKAQGKVAPGSWQYAMLRDNLKALRLACELMDKGVHSTARVEVGELREAFTALALMISKTESAQAIASLGKSQHTLLRNRLKSLRMAAGVVKGQLNERRHP